MGYIAVGLLALLALGLLWLLKVRGPVLTLAGAAIAFGCAGYAVQGSPEDAARFVTELMAQVDELRRAVFGKAR